jgi:predicted DNA-binding transcriptional regulator AlpA
MSLLEKLQVVKDSDMPGLLTVSDRTWDRMKQAGDHPPKIQISERRIGYRVADIEDWQNKKRLDENFQPIGAAMQRVVESCGADIRDHNIKMQRELNRQKGD